MEAASGTAVTSREHCSTLARALDAQARSMRAEADLLASVVEWAAEHSVSDGDAVPGAGAAGHDLGGGRWCPLAGEGTPLVEEFAVPELAAALGMSSRQGASLVGDALELAFRLPRTWARVQACEVPVWRARILASRTTRLDPASAAWVDRQVSPVAEKLTTARVIDLVDAALRRLALSDPSVVIPGSDDPGVDLTPILDGRVLLRGVLEVDDAAALSARVAEVAERLGQLGDNTELGARRARALGILADPRLAVDLLDERVADAGVLASRRREAAPDLVLYVHVAAEEVAAESGVARAEGRGALGLDRVADWAGRFPVSVRPVIDLDERISVDAYEIPERLREQVLARDPVCVFPWCGVRSHRRDVDHITPYSPNGPPGQTSSENLAPLCRSHHRLKTHGGWRYRRASDGSYLWLSPEGREYAVTHLGTSSVGPAA